MKSKKTCPLHKAKANRPNQTGRVQIASAEKIILMPASQYFANRDTEGICYGSLYIGIAAKNGVYLPIQSTKHYWLCDDIDKARRAVRKSNIDSPIVVTTFQNYLELIEQPDLKPAATRLLQVKHHVENSGVVAKEIQKAFGLLESGEKITVTLEISTKGHSISFSEQTLVGSSHITDENMQIVYYRTADEAIKAITPLQLFINCRFYLNFTDIAKFHP